jgi:hypothetical protein
VDDDLVLVVENNKSQRGIVILNTELGNYKTRQNRNYEVEFGELVDFFCPHCSHSLEYEEHFQFVRILKEELDKSASSVIFSKIKGEECTLVKDSEHHESYGEHAMRFTDPEWFLKIDAMV